MPIAERRKLFVVSVADGVHHEDALFACRLSWKNDVSPLLCANGPHFDKQFAADYADAKQARDSLRQEIGEDKLFEHGVRGVLSPVYQAGRLAGLRTELNDTMTRLYYRGNYGHKYVEKSEIGGPDGKPLASLGVIVMPPPVEPPRGEVPT